MSNQAEETRFSEFHQRLISAAVEVLAGHGVDQSEDIGREIVDRVCETFAGDQVYIGKGFHARIEARNQKIWTAFRDSNYHALAEQFDLTPRQIRAIVEGQRQADIDRRQGRFSF